MTDVPVRFIPTDRAPDRPSRLVDDFTPDLIDVGEQHGYPILISDLIARLEGAAYVARCAVNTAGNVARTKRLITRALETQLAGRGFSFVESLTMCPTGWFIETEEAPAYLDGNLAAVHAGGVLKDW